MKARLTIAVMLLLSAVAVMADGMPVYADGGPIFLCPPGSKTCKCTVTSCK